ncbi:hypothetical protein ACQZV8_21165, partial [Magnetococcales bacterium HHB-1]
SDSVAVERDEKSSLSSLVAGLPEDLKSKETADSTYLEKRVQSAHRMRFAVFLNVPQDEQN